MRRQVEQFVLAFDSNLAPVVGQQATHTRDNASAVAARIDLLKARADVGECELIVKSGDGDDGHGYLYKGAGMFQVDRARKPLVQDAYLRASVRGNDAITYTCTPPGSGIRMGLDRDEDGYYDGDERSAKSDPADPNSVPPTNRN